MKTVEWDGEKWNLVVWEDKGYLVRVGKVVAALRSKKKEDAECEAMLQGWL